MRRRSAVVLIQDGKIALMKRIRNGKTYYVIPGGGIEEGESPEQAAEREVFEELGLVVAVSELITTLHYSSMQYYFSARIIDGEFGSGCGDEFTDKYRDRGIYIPTWIEISKLNRLDLRPNEIIPYIKDYFQL